MPTAKPMTSEDPEQLSRVISAARRENDSLMNNFAGREDEIDELETEIIQNYTNNDDSKLAQVPDHLDIQSVLAATQRHLSRVTEIYAGSLRNVAKLKATQSMLLNAILPLIQGASADIRNAKAADCVQSINYLIQLESGLVDICDLTIRNLKIAQETASRVLKGYELDLTFFDGASTYAAIVKASKKKRNLT